MDYPWEEINCRDAPNYDGLPCFCYNAGIGNSVTYEDCMHELCGYSSSEPLPPAPQVKKWYVDWYLMSCTQKKCAHPDEHFWTSREDCIQDCFANPNDNCPKKPPAVPPPNNNTYICIYSVAPGPLHNISHCVEGKGSQGFTCDDCWESGINQGPCKNKFSCVGSPGNQYCVVDNMHGSFDIDCVNGPCKLPSDTLALLNKNSTCLFR